LNAPFSLGNKLGELKAVYRCIGPTSVVNVFRAALSWQAKKGAMNEQKNAAVLCWLLKDRPTII